VTHTPSTYGSHPLLKKMSVFNFIVDTGANSHVINDASMVINWTSKRPEECEGAFPGMKGTSIGRGDCAIMIYNHSTRRYRRQLLRNCAIIPGARRNLISGPSLEDDGLYVYTKDRSITGITEDGAKIRYHFERSKGRLYTLDCPLVTNDQWMNAARVYGKTARREGGDLIACATAMGVAAVNAVRAATVATMASAGASKTIADVSQLVHERCGHLGLPYQKLMTGLSHLPFCKACALSKAVRKARNKGQRTVPKLPFEKVHVDIAGPFVESDS